MRFPQHGAELLGDRLGVGKFGVGDDANIGILHHQQQQIVERQRRILIQDRLGEELVKRRDMRRVDAVLQTADPVVPQHGIAVGGHANVRLEYTHARVVMLLEALEAVESLYTVHCAEGVGYDGVFRKDLGGVQLAHGLALLGWDDIEQALRLLLCLTFQFLELGVEQRALRLRQLAAHAV